VQTQAASGDAAAAPTAQHLLGSDRSFPTSRCLMRVKDIAARLQAAAPDLGKEVATALLGGVRRGMKVLYAMEAHLTCSALDLDKISQNLILKQTERGLREDAVSTFNPKLHIQRNYTPNLKPQILILRLHAPNSKPSTPNLTPPNPDPKP